MITPKISLIVVTRNKQSLTYDSLSLRPDKYIAPNVDIEDTNVPIMDMVYNLFEKHVCLDHHLINFMFLDNQHSDNILNLRYYCLIPFNIKTMNTFFLSIDYYARHHYYLQKVLNVL